MVNKILIIALVFLSTGLFAGNEDRAGEAGASQLLINPWARSSGLAGSNTANVRGLEAMSLNVAGLSFLTNTEVNMSYTSWLSGTDINIFNFGIGQKVGESGVLGITFTSVNFGDLEITTVDLPDGGIGNFNPNYFNVGIGYSKKFSNSISGGLVVRLVTENTASVNASGVGIDAGVNYTTGDNDAFKFGITLRNVGPTMKYSGNGLATRADIQNSDKSLTLNQRSNSYELPSLVNIGMSYDFFLTEVEETEDGGYFAEHRVTGSGTFTSNSFTKDQIRIGAEYAFQEKFMARFGYVFESDTQDDIDATTTSVGPTFGATIEVPMGKSGSMFGLDYSYRVTRTFNGSNAIGVRLTF